ncbi:hypothetical protein LCGC14_3168800 [marine sediment metagenome]|uniref:Uncharacterized protein n=1 Tax=marine sediment metagenome TaxID=412755 RepID=A0A0F8VFL7_9ZZZZ
MTDIDSLLEQARKNSKGYGEKYGCKETADDYLKSTYASIYASAIGETVGERDAWVRRHEEYRKAIERKQNAYADWKTAETYMRLLFAQTEVWRSVQANNRYMDSAHR